MPARFCNRNRPVAPKFKYQDNCSSDDLDSIRRLLKLEHSNLSHEDCSFWKPDYDRLMIDDWLVSRFLLRGQRMGKKLQVMDSKDDSEKYLETMKLVRACAEFRKLYRINGLTDRSEFPNDWLKVEGLLNYKPDRAGNPTIYLRAKLHQPKLIESDDKRHEFKRLLLYTLEKCDQDLMNNQGRGICCIFDLTEATFENVDLELVSWMMKSCKCFGPKLLCYVIIYNLPWFLSATFRLISKTLLAGSNEQTLKFVNGEEILDYIEYDNLPPYLVSSI